MAALMECVPNFSTGDLAALEGIADCYRARRGVKLLDYSADADHGRGVITAAGEPEALLAAVVDSVGEAVRRIDLNVHSGEHPRIGAADVIPFVPVRGCTLQDADEIARRGGQEIARRYGIPCYLYEHTAAFPHRRNLADIRRGQFEGLAEKMKDPLWKPDFGPDRPHPTAGACVIGARFPLIAFNVNLNTADVAAAKAIARRIRERDGGLPGVKALGVLVGGGSTAQVTMNLVDYTKTGADQAFLAVREEARRMGLEVVGSELIGLLPGQAAADALRRTLMLPGMDADRILEVGCLEQ